MKRRGFLKMLGMGAAVPASAWSSIAPLYEGRPVIDVLATANTSRAAEWTWSEERAPVADYSIDLSQKDELARKLVEYGKQLRVDMQRLGAKSSKG